jgi:acyl dehydratase
LEEIMTTIQPAVDWSAETSAKITPEHLARARLLVGRDLPASRRQPMTTASEDNIRMFAFAYGSDNPLFADPAYARKTRWGGVIAPGPMTFTMGEALLGDPPDEAVVRAKKGLFKGIHNVHSGTDWRWYRPVRPGDTIYSFRGEESVEVKKSQFAGQSVMRTGRIVRMNQRAEVIAVERTLMVLSERATAASRGKYSGTERATYTADDIAAIDAVYAGETVRGAEPRFWEDVEIGEGLGVMAKGPLTVTDIICFHLTGFAVEPFGLATGRLAYQRRRKMPGAFIKDGHGVPDTVIRMHWDDAWAQALGSPIAYDYAYQRECWLYHYLTDWCGDDGIVLRVHDEMRKFNYIGDTQTITGKVVGKTVDGDRAMVDVAVEFTNQRGEMTVKADATIALPSRTHGAADYPAAPDDITARAQAFMARHRELSGASLPPP